MALSVSFGPLIQGALNTNDNVVVLTTAQLAGDVLVVVIVYDPAVSVSTVTDTSGNTYTQLTSTSDAGAGGQDVWYAKNVAAASASANSITVHFSATTGGGNNATIYGVRGADTAAPLDVAFANNDASGTTTAITSGSHTTVHADEILFGFTAVEHTVTAGEAGWTVSAVDGFGNISEYLITTSAGSYAATATQNLNGSSIMAMVSFAAPSSPALPPETRRRRSQILNERPPLERATRRREFSSYLYPVLLPPFSQGAPFNEQVPDLIPRRHAFNPALFLPQGVSASGSAAMSPFAVTAAGSIIFIGSGAAAMSSFGASGSAEEDFLGSGSAALSSFASSGSGAEEFDGTCTAALSPFACAGAGSETFMGSGTAACSPFAASGSGALGTVFSGTCTAALSSFAVAGTGAEGFTATGAAALQSYAIAGSGAEGFTGSGSAVLQSFAAAGSGVEGSAFVGTGTAALSSFGVAGSGSEAFIGIGVAALSPFAAGGIGSLSISGSGSVALSPFAVAGSGLFIIDIVGSGAAALSSFAAAGFAGVPGGALAVLKPQFISVTFDLTQSSRISPTIKI